MADISKINPNGTEYNLKDATARSAIENTNENIQSSITVPKASVVTVADAAPINAEDITVDITPQQDLHGYDRPWAGGGWKNKLPMTVAGIKAANRDGTWSGNTYTINNGTVEILVDSGNNVIGLKVNGTFSANTFFSLFGLQEYATNNYILTGINISHTQTELQLYYRDLTNSQDVNPRDSGEGATIRLQSGRQYTGYLRISYGYTASSKIIYPMIRLASETDPTFAPYSNICPIEGRTGAELDRVGKNEYIGSPSFDGYINRNSYSLSSETHNGHEVIYKSGTWGGAYKTLNLGKGTYTFSVMVKCSATATVSLYDTINGESTQLAVATVGTSWQRVSTTFEVTEQRTASLRINLQTSNTTIYISEYQLELGSTATTYEPYQGQQYTASFGETVHGGKWHVTAGGTDKTHGNIASYNGETINEPWLSSLDEYVAGATPTTGAQVVYPLTTPTTISTPKQNVPMLKGINTVYADCGDVSLKYQPDNVVGELKGEIQVANSFVAKMALRQGSGAKDFSYGGWSFRIRIFRSMGQISLYVENISASNVTEQAIVKVFMDTSDYRAPEELRPRMNIVQAATYTTPSGWAIQVYLEDDGYIMFTGVAPEVGASAPTSSNWNLVEPWAAHQQAKDLFNN